MNYTVPPSICYAIDASIGKAINDTIGFPVDCAVSDDVLGKMNRQVCEPIRRVGGALFAQMWYRTYDEIANANKTTD